MIDKVILDKVIHFGKYISRQNIKIWLSTQLTNPNLYYIMQLIKFNCEFNHVRGYRATPLITTPTQLIIHTCQTNCLSLLEQLNLEQLNCYGSKAEISAPSLIFVIDPPQ